jgi:hypothetical protein
MGFLLIGAGLLLFLRPGKGRGRFGALGRRGVGVVLGLAGLGFLASTSFVVVDANRVGHLKRIYAFNELPPGRIIAMDGQKGPQARILGPGFHVIPLVRVLYDFEQSPVITVPEGFYGQITTLDGAPMPGACSSPRRSTTTRSPTC